LAVSHAYDPGSQIIEVQDRVLVLESKAGVPRLANRLALAHRINALVDQGVPKDAPSIAEDLDHGSKSFRVRVKGYGTSPESRSLERELGGLIQGKGPVRLDSPEVEFRFLYTKHRVYATELLAEMDRGTPESRIPSKRPFFQPVSLHPRYARALVNLTELRERARVLDPFCGTGGILLEAGLMGLTVRGSDLRPDMIAGCRKTLAAWKVRAELECCDVGELKERFDPVAGIATDPPYGRSASTRGEKLEDLLARAFDSFREVNPRGRVAILVPDRSLLKKSRDRYEIQNIYPQRIHRSLTRYFCVLT